MYLRAAGKRVIGNGEWEQARPPLPRTPYANGLANRGGHLLYYEALAERTYVARAADSVSEAIAEFWG
jgi:hypothetical protein